jgi:hypothetical protein
MAPHSEHSPDFSSSDEPVTIDIPVLVVGGGPTGLLEAHMLSKLGGLPSLNDLLILSLTLSSEVSRY